MYNFQEGRPYCSMSSALYELLPSPNHVNIAWLDWFVCLAEEWIMSEPIQSRAGRKVLVCTKLWHWRAEKLGSRKQRFSKVQRVT
jgi:hypothetical protein